MVGILFPIFLGLLIGITVALALWTVRIIILRRRRNAQAQRLDEERLRPDSKRSSGWSSIDSPALPPVSATPPQLPALWEEQESLDKQFHQMGLPTAMERVQLSHERQLERMWLEQTEIKSLLRARQDDSVDSWAAQRLDGLQYFKTQVELFEQQEKKRRLREAALKATQAHISKEEPAITSHPAYRERGDV